MYKQLLITITTGSILILSGCSGGIESDIKTALDNDKELMPICGSFQSSTRTITINGLHKTSIKTYPVKGFKPKGSELETFKNGAKQCYGSRSVNNIEEFTTPSDFGGMKITKVVFSYEMEFNDLARNIRVDEFIRDAYAKPLQAKAVLIETNKGWRVDKITWAPSNLFGKTRLISSEKYDREESPNCAACQDLLKNGIDFSNISTEITGMFRDKNHFSSSCVAVRRSCGDQYNINF